MNKILTTAIGLGAAVLFAGALVSVSAQAERGWGGPRSLHRFGGPPVAFGGPPMERVLEALDLTPEQRAAIEDIETSYRPRLEALHESGREGRRRLLETPPDDPDYATVVAEASLEAGQNASQLVNLMAELRREVFALLTPEQRAKASELRAELAARLERRWQRRRARRASGPEA